MTPTGKAVVTIDLDESELATVLAALRLFQDEFDNVDAKTIRKAFPLHFQRTDDSLIEPLGSDDIGKLCEQINCAGVMDRVCTCDERSWYGDEHDTACQLEGTR